MAIKGKNIKNAKRVFTESKSSLKLKEKIRNFREKNLFYLEHSKFATYIDPDYLRIYETELVNFTKKWIRMFDQNMSAEREPGMEGHANTRGLHSMDTEQGAKDVARKLLLNEDLARVGAKGHDLGHLIYAHEGEHRLSEYLKKLGIAELHHSTLARMIMEEEKIHQRTLERLSKEKGRTFTKKEIEEYEGYKLILADIAAAHNGEGLDYEVIANNEKTNNDIENEFIASFTKPGADRKIVSKTPEGAVVRFSDPIAYVFKDFRDGVIGGTIDVNDLDYEDIFIKMGIPKETLDEWALLPEKKDKLVRIGTYILRDNLYQSSIGFNGARMSKEMADLMYKLRDLNYEKVVKPRTRKIMDVLGERTEKLIDKYSNLLIKYEDPKAQNIELNTHTKKMIRRLTMKQPEEVKEININITRKGIESFVRREIDDVLKGENKCVTTRRKRYEADIASLKAEGRITDEVKETYIKRVLKEINLSPEESQKMLRKRIKIEYPNATPDQIERLAKENSYLRLETFTESLAKLRTTMYIGEASNDYLLEVLQAEELLTQEERKGRWISGGDVNKSSINATIASQDRERKSRKKDSDGR